MFGAIFATLGSSLGKYFGGGILSTIGRYGGKMLGDSLDKKWFHQTQIFHKYTNAKDSFYLSSAKYGTPIPLIFGRMRIPGKIIWADKIKEIHHNSTTERTFKKQNVTAMQSTTEIEYYLSFAMAICEGEITEIGRVWHGDELIDLSNYTFRLYKGSDQQLPDPLINLKMDNQSTAYRDLAYIVFEEMPLADFDDMIPNFSFEVTRKAQVKLDYSVEDKVESMTMIPGSGEYVYDTKIQTKTLKSPMGGILSTTHINYHNIYKISNSVHSLNQLQLTCKNIKWLSPVACWFGNSIDIKDCLIRPGIEYNDPYIEYSEKWQVGNYDRSNAYAITKDMHGNPIYGGSVNDASILRYLQEIRSRKIKIMFYPMFFLDVNKKPWRGRLTGEAQYIKDFFNKQHGYNDFILHYANLVKNDVDAFVIGSELIGLTSINYQNTFPAVDELVKLAQLVKDIVGNEVLVTYAADWSEYHHTQGGWYNLDPLWASPNIDFVGIDAYFPVTKTKSSVITADEIANGWMSGEGYDYYINYKNNTKHALSPEYAWKNLNYWWENQHKNPDDNWTKWQPKSKKIWFTEFGFPSIDKAPNQPNVFFDPFCLDGGVPRDSNGEADFSIQRRSINAFIDYWKKQEFIGQMFLWTWDARPYPAWPHMNIWRDNYLWQKGHWVNNKFGISSLGAIIAEISKRCNIDPQKIEVSSIDDIVEGAIFTNQITATNAINIFRTSYFFDLSACYKDKICFVKRGLANSFNIGIKDCIKLDGNSYILQSEITPDSVLAKIDFYFIDQEKDYDTNYLHINGQKESSHNCTSIRLPIVFSAQTAEKIGNIILSNAAAEEKIIQFIIHNNSDNNFTPCNFIRLQNYETIYNLRIIETIYKHLQIEITAIIDNVEVYFQNNNSKAPTEIEYIEKTETKLIFLDLPFYLKESKIPYIAAYLNNDTKLPLYAKINSDFSNSWRQLANLIPSGSIAKVVEFNHDPKSNIFLTDENSEIIIRGVKLSKNLSSSGNIAMVGQEIIGFKKMQELQKGIYKISELARGLFATEIFMDSHKPEEDFVIINLGPNIIELNNNLERIEITFKILNNYTNFTYINKANKLLSPFITDVTIKNNMMIVTWVSRNSNFYDWESFDAEKKIQFNVQISFDELDKTILTSEHFAAIDITNIALSRKPKICIIPKYN